MKITIIIYKRLFILFPNFITKESYNWWVTKRVWGFRHQISKAKYLKMSVAHIGKLQENTVALCKKWLQNSPGKRYRRIRICLTEEVETPSFPIRHQNSGCNTSGWNGGGEVSGCETFGWNVRCHMSRRLPMVCPDALSG